MAYSSSIGSGVKDASSITTENTGTNLMPPVALMFYFTPKCRLFLPFSNVSRRPSVSAVADICDIPLRFYIIVRQT